MARLYQMTSGDIDILRRALFERDWNIASNYYLSSSHSGTWWDPVDSADVEALEMEEGIALAKNWQSGYATLRGAWEGLNKPEYFRIANGPEALTEEAFNLLVARREVVYRAVVTRVGKVSFFHPHGFLFLPWQLEMTRRQESVIVIPGGYGSGKTMAAVAHQLLMAISHRKYSALALAPSLGQSNEMFDIAVQRIMEGTLFEKRFLIKVTSSYPKTIVVGNSAVGESTIMFGSADNPAKFLSLTRDAAIVDQAEQIDDLPQLLRSLASRYRGRVDGREREARTFLLANSANNADLWALVDTAKERGSNVWTYAPGSFENRYLTIRNLREWERRFPTIEERNRYLRGDRPIGSGMHFPELVIRKCHDPDLDAAMEEQLKSESNIGWKYARKPGADPTLWKMPYVEGNRYIVGADPGWDNAPNRNSAAIMVWDVTDFPSRPATLACFHWVDGNNRPDPWMSAFVQYVQEYHAVGMCGFDSTGLQSGYERLGNMQEIGVIPLAFTLPRKMSFLNISKVYMGKGWLRMAYIGSLFEQLSRYETPETDKMRQDLVMCLLICCALMEMVFYALSSEKAKHEISHIDPLSRDFLWDAPEDRAIEDESFGWGAAWPSGENY